MQHGCVDPPSSLTSMVRSYDWFFPKYTIYSRQEGVTLRNMCRDDESQNRCMAAPLSLGLEAPTYQPLGSQDVGAPRLGSGYVLYLCTVSTVVSTLAHATVQSWVDRRNACNDRDHPLRLSLAIKGPILLSMPKPMAVRDRSSVAGVLLAAAALLLSITTATASISLVSSGFEMHASMTSPNITWIMLADNVRATSTSSAPQQPDSDVASP